MAFELILQSKSLSQDGKQITIEDASDWSQEPNDRADYGILVEGYHVTDVSTALEILSYNPVTAAEWIASISTNGRYQFKAYRFFEISSANAPAPVLNDVRWDSVSSTLKKYDGATWVETDMATDKASAEMISTALELPLLNFAYAYKNLLNLEYITVFKEDLAKGARQNKLYYKRTELDYFKALITGAEYNWALGLYSQYQDIVENINVIINTGKLV